MPATGIQISPHDFAADRSALGPRPAFPERLQPRLLHVLDLFESSCHGDRMASARLAEEAMSTSDFPYLMGTAIDRSLLQYYRSVPSVWERFASRSQVNDFRPKRWDDLLGGMALLDEVAELDEYPQGSVSEAEYSLTVRKYGRRIGISWELIINDNLNALQQLPGRLAQAAKNTENQLATRVLVTAAGPDATFFSAGHGNKLAGNPALSVTSLQAAWTHLATKRDADGNPIVLSGAVLMVPPALFITASNIVNAQLTRAITGGGDGTGNDQLEVRGNGIPGNLEVVSNPWIPTIDVSGTATTTWYLLPTPNAGRPALTLGFLRGHETPDLRVKADTGSSLGGGPVGPEEGSFDNDDIAWRIRHVTGGVTLDPNTAVVSTGAGT